MRTQGAPSSRDALMTEAASEIDFSLCRGGPLHRLLRRSRIVTGGPVDLRREILVLVGLAWLPLAALTLEALVRSGSWPPLALHIPVHVRPLIGVPLLVAHEYAVDGTSRRAVLRFARTGIAPRAGVRAAAENAARLRDARTPELLLVLTALTSSQVALWSSGGAGVFETKTALHPGHLTGLELWYFLVTLPLFQFLLGRVVWRWILWARLLWQVSRLPLRLFATHPDLAGGLAFVNTSSAAAALAVASVSSVLSAFWASRILADPAVNVADFTAPFTLFVLFVEALIIAPLLAFIGHCFRARWAGLAEYGDLARQYAQSFHERWVDPGPQGNPHGISNGQQLLGSADIQSLADMGNSLSVVQRMRILPATPRLLLTIFVAALVPMLPLMATEKSLWELAGLLARGLVGGVAP